jgi:hypothetical protein
VLIGAIDGSMVSPSLGSLLPYDFAISSAEEIMPFSACTAELLSP